MFMKLSRAICVLAVGVSVSASLAGCAEPGQGWMGSPLKDTAWKLVTVESSANDAGRQYVANQVDITMTLRASGDAFFVVGCEQGTTDWRATPGAIESKGEIYFQSLELAASSCEPDTAVQAFISDVEFMQGYVMIQNHLYLNTRANAKTYGWRQMPLQ